MADTAETNVIVANENKLTSYGSGETKIHTQHQTEKKIALKGILYVPEIEYNLLSESKTTKRRL